MSSPQILPIISRELQFAARNAEELDAICDETIDVGADVKALVDKVYEKATENASELLYAARDRLNHAARSLCHINWQRYSRTLWQLYGGVYSSKTSYLRLGSAGFNICSGKEGFRLVGWARCYGGVAKLEELTYVCRKKLSSVHLTSEHPNRYPGWVGGDDVVVWLDVKLNGNVTFQEVGREIDRRAVPFFKSAKPILKRRAKR